MRFMSLDDKGSSGVDDLEEAAPLDPAEEISSLFRVTLREVLENYIEVPLSAVVISSEVSTADYNDLLGVFEGHRFELHRILSECFTSEYPEVCDVASALVLGIADALFGNRFDLYQVSGTFAESDIGHCWSLLINRINRTGYIVDLTYVQFLSGSLSLYRFTDSRGTVHERMNYDNFKQRAIQDIYSVAFPISVIPLSDARSSLWHPSHIIEVL